MTTTIFTDLLGPMCELYYKYNRDLDIYQANINTIRNFGQSTNYSLNFGFELYQPFDINNVQLQPGVYTTNSTLIAKPILSTNVSTIPVSNFIVMQELPILSVGIVTYTNKTLPIIIGIQSSVAGPIGIMSSYATNGIPYNYSSDIDQAIIRQFESDFVTNSNLSILLFINLENTTFVGIQTNNWSVLQTSLYSLNAQSYRYNNGYGQFYSDLANEAFIYNLNAVDHSVVTSLYQGTYSLIYNWINNLIWVPNFLSWYSTNKTIVPYFLRKFLNDFFNIV